MTPRESEEIKKLIYSRCDHGLLSPTRIHPLKTFSTPEALVLVKREDESGFGISGCKKRKYASLIPFLRENHIRKAVLTGGSHSNHLPGIVQLLRENQIQPELLVKKNHHSSLKGNSFLLHLLTTPDEITWVSSSGWKDVETLAENRVKAAGFSAFFIPEGGSCEPALPGAMTLMADIERNETESGLQFDHIFIDSGTGLVAAALVIMNHILSRKTQIHVVLIAGDEQAFHSTLHKAGKWAEQLTGKQLGEIVFPNVHLPDTGKSFGSTNATVFAETKRLAEEEGILTDPVYTTKLFMTARTAITTLPCRGNVLIIHSGGGTGLMGWQEAFG
ncbi:MAG: pyridoxal-phosphate dependent enzyme [Bacteroidia bacterium]